MCMCYIYIYMSIVYLGLGISHSSSSPRALRMSLPMDKTELLYSTQALFFSGLHRLTFQ